MPDDELGPVERPSLGCAPSEDRGPVPGDLTAQERAEPGEEWIEEYESEQRDMRPRKRLSHPIGIAMTVTLVLVLVLWTLLSPQVLPVAGTQYVDSPVHANLGSFSGDLEIRWLLNMVLVADTTWGVSVSGDRNVTAGEMAYLSVHVTKVREDMKNAWFAGTSINLKKADLFVDGGPQLGSMVSKSDETFGPLAVVGATFDSPGNYSCFVFVEIAIYGKMLVGFAPVKVLRMTVPLATLDVS